MIDTSVKDIKDGFLLNISLIFLSLLMFYFYIWGKVINKVQSLNKLHKLFIFVVLNLEISGIICKDYDLNILK